MTASPVRGFSACGDYPQSRLAQQDVAPMETPKFALLNPQGLDPALIQLQYPLFVKPVKSWFSQFARQVDTFEELAEYVPQPAVFRPEAALAALAAVFAGQRRPAVGTGGGRFRGGHVHVGSPHFPRRARHGTLRGIRTQPACP